MQDNMLALEQRQVLSAKQVQSLEILTYTNQELEDFLLNEYLERRELRYPVELLRNTGNSCRKHIALVLLFKEK
ncbi:MAG: hypothetical protein ACRDBO_18070 [Lachnospiraceae bacterium]